jgi:hypothetical protein
MVRQLTTGRFAEALRKVGKRLLPSAVTRRILAQWRRREPVDWGDLRRLTPVSRTFGLDRGQPIDRYYIERFLLSRRTDIRGRVLEVGGSEYTRRFGADQVEQSEVLHAVAGNPSATLIGDLATGDGIPKGSFDCLILTQTLHFVYRLEAAVANSFAALSPGGVLLATFPGISQISRYDMDRWGDWWRLTDASARRLFGDIFDPANVEVVCSGNVLAACAFLQGLATDELNQKELDWVDPDYQVLIAVRAVKRPAK